MDDTDSQGLSRVELVAAVVIGLGLALLVIRLLGSGGG